MKKVYDVIEHNNVMGSKRVIKTLDNLIDAKRFAGVTYTNKKAKSYTIVERIM